jgi:protein-disulfide isomerase
MHGISKPFQVNFHVLPFKKPSNTSHFVPLFLAHEDIVVRFAIFHIVIFQKRKKKKNKIKKALLHGM